MPRGRGMASAAAAAAVAWAVAASPCGAWQPVVVPGGTLSLTPGSAVRPGEVATVGVVGFGTDLVPQEVALTMQAMSAQLASADGHSIPLSRLEWAFRTRPTDALAFRPLQAGPVPVYRGPGGWAGDLVWRFKPAWADPAASAPYEVSIAYTLSLATVDSTPVVVVPDPYPLGSGQSLDFYVYRPARGAVMVYAWMPAQGPCSTGWGYGRGRYFTVEAGWNRLQWSPSTVDFPVTRPGAYCYAVSASTFGPMVGGGGFQAVEASRGQTLRVHVTADPDGRPVAGAGVELGEMGAPAGRAASTGADGTARFSGLLPGRYTLAVRAAGYRSATVPVTVAPGETPAPVHVRLREEVVGRLDLELRAPPGARALRVGDPVEVRVRAEWPAGGSPERGRVELDLGPGLVPLLGPDPPGSEGEAGRVVWQAPVLVWEWTPAPGHPAASLTARAVVTPLAVAQPEVRVAARGWVGSGERRVELLAAAGELPVTEADVPAGLVVGVVSGLRGSAGGGVGTAVVAEDGTTTPVDPSGPFAMRLRPGMHVLRVHDPDGQPAWGPPVVVSVKAGQVVPVVMESRPEGSPAPDPGSGPVLIAAGTLEWTWGAPPSAAGGVTLKAAGAGYEALAAVGVSTGGVRLGSLAMRAGSHRVVVGDVRRLAGEGSGATGGEGAARPTAGRWGPSGEGGAPEGGEVSALGDWSLLHDDPLPERGVLWEWKEGRAGLTARWTEPGASSSRDEGTAAGLVRAVAGDTTGRLWAGVRMQAAEGPEAAGTGAWVLGAGWEGRREADRVQAEFVQGPAGGGWGIAWAGSGGQVLLRHRAGEAWVEGVSGRTGAPPDSEPARYIEARVRPARAEGALRSVGAGLLLAGAADLHAGFELAWPWRAAAPEPGTTGAVLLETRVGAVLPASGPGEGAPPAAASGPQPRPGDARPYAEGSLSVPLIGASALRGSAGVRLRAGEPGWTGLPGWTAWADVSARGGERLEVGLKASLHGGAGGPALRLQGELGRGGPLRVTGRAAASPARMEWEELAVAYEAERARGNLRLLAGRVEAEAAAWRTSVSGPRDPAGGGRRSRWYLRGSLRWPTGRGSGEPEVDLAGWWWDGALAVAGQLDLERAAVQVRMGVARSPGGGATGTGTAEGPYAEASWRRAGFHGGAVGSETLGIRAGWRAELGPDWGWFAEGDYHVVSVRGEPAGVRPVFRGGVVAVGLYAAPWGETSGRFIEAGWRMASFDVPVTVLERLGPSLRPGWFVRVSGWWTPGATAATISRGP